MVKRVKVHGIAKKWLWDYEITEDRELRRFGPSIGLEVNDIKIVKKGRKK